MSEYPPPPMNPYPYYTPPAPAPGAQEPWSPSGAPQQPSGSPPSGSPPNAPGTYGGYAPPSSYGQPGGYGQYAPSSAPRAPGGGYPAPGSVPPPGGQHPGAPYPGQGYSAWRPPEGGSPPSGRRALPWPAWVLIAMSGVLLLCSIAGYAVLRNPLFAPAEATFSQQATARAPVRAPKWTFKATDHIHYTGTPYGGPVIANGLIYLSSGDGVDTLLAVNAADGTLKWSAPGGWWPTVVADGVAYAFSSQTNMFNAYNAGTGALKWTFHNDNEISLSPPVVMNGTVYVAGRNAVYALKSADGTLEWTFDGFYPYPPMDTGVAANGLLYVVGADSMLYVLNGTTGAPVWTRPLATLPPASHVFAAEGTLYLNDSSHLYALNGTDGKQLWSFAVTKPVAQIIAEADGLVYAAEGLFNASGFYVRGTLAMSASSGASKWQNDQGEPVAVLGGTVIMKKTNAICALNAADGKQRWCKQANYDDFSVASGVFYGTAMNTVTYKRTSYVNNRKVVVFDIEYQRTLVALDATTGATRWTSSTLSESTFMPNDIFGIGVPLVVGGVVYQLMSDGRLYAIKA